MVVLPPSSIVEYLDTLNLPGDEQVNVYLSAEFRSQLAYPRRGSIHDFTLPVEVNGQLVSPHGFPLAQVYGAAEAREYGTRPGQVKDIRKILDRDKADKWYPQERILEPFLYQHIPLGLERGMSSDSILYVFSGFVNFVKELDVAKDHVRPPVTLAGREIDEDFLSLLYSRTAGIFQGYRLRTPQDLDLLAEEAQNSRRNGTE